MTTVFTNSNERRDFFGDALLREGAKPGHIHVAVAFLTDASPLLQMSEAGSRLRVIVRLGFPTMPRELRRLLKAEGIQVRYSTSESFHPKLYIFVDRCALVGSSNMTNSAMWTNQEVNVRIAAEADEYPVLEELFHDYWSQLQVLRGEVVDSYERIYRRFAVQRRDLRKAEKQIESLGQSDVSNIQRSKRTRKVGQDLYVDAFRATYQEFHDAFRTLRRIYAEMGRRKFQDDVLPLRIEIDNFLGWLREAHAKGETYKSADLLHGDALEAKVRKYAREWFETDWRWLNEVVVADSYPRISRILRSPQAIRAADYDQLIEALSCAHSFYDRLRFFAGGHKTHVKVFREENDVDRVKKTLIYLLYGTDEFVVRMARSIYDSDYKLRHFGRSASQEILGWVNGDDIPICNNRTLRSLRWLGFDVPLVGG